MGIITFTRHTKLLSLMHAKEADMKTASHKAPGKAHREGISLLELANLFPDERAAEKWFEQARWGDEPHCPRCGGLEKIREVASRKPMKWHCGDCRRYFSVRIGTVLERSKIPLRKWAYAIYLWTTSLKGVSSMKLHRDLGLSQKAAWFMAHRLREAYLNGGGLFGGPVEVDEMYVGGKRANMSNAKRKELREQGLGRGPAGKTAVVGMKDRETKQVVARVINRTDRETLQGFVDEHASPDAVLFTDDATAYRGSGRTHETVKHGAAEYVRYLESGPPVHTNGVESLWSMFKRGFIGTYHRMSPKHLHRYVAEFTARQNVRDQHTIDQMHDMVRRMIGRRLMYRELVS